MDYYWICASETHYRARLAGGAWEDAAAAELQDFVRQLVAEGRCSC